MEVFALFSTDEKPQSLKDKGFSIRDGDECRVPLPLPDMVLVFALGPWPKELEGQMLRIQISIEDVSRFTLGSISKEDRSLCWQGEWSDDLYIKSELMLDPESTGMLFMIPEPIRPITPPCVMFTPDAKRRTEEESVAEEEKDEAPQENSQTESQRMETMGIEWTLIRPDDEEEDGNGSVEKRDDKVSASTGAKRVKVEEEHSKSEACQPSVKKPSRRRASPVQSASTASVEKRDDKVSTPTGAAERVQVKEKQSESEACQPSVKKPSRRKASPVQSASTASSTTATTRKKRKASSELPPEPKTSKSSSTSKRSTRPRTCQSVENKTKTATSESKPKAAPIRDITSFMKTGPRPTPRWGHSLCDIGNHQALLIGGQGSNQVLAKDSVWLLNTDTKEWEVPSITMDTHSHYRMGHTATFDPKVKCLYVFGGSKNLRWYNDIHVLDLDNWKWSLVKANGKAPTRAYHTSTLFRNELFIFGGVFPNADPAPDGCSNQVFVYSPGTESWYEPVLQGDRPKARSGHSATLLGDKVVIFGGWDAPQCYNDLHILDLCLMEFTSPSLSGKAPSPRTWHGAMALPGNRVLIHGGYDGDMALRDSFIFDLDSLSWTPIKLSSQVCPRAGHSLLNISPDVSITSSSTEDLDDEKENTPRKMIKTGGKITQRMMVFAGGDNDGAFFNDLMRVNVKIDEHQ